MGVLGKDLFDWRRPMMNTMVQFGSTSYWVEDNPTPIPYCTVLTELLNYDPEPYFQKFVALEKSMADKDLETISDHLYALAEEVMVMPFYRTFIMFSEQVDPLAYLASEDANAHLYLAEDVVSGKYDPYHLTSYDKICEDLEVIQRRYTWFLDEFYKGVVFEKKKGQRKYPLAEQIKKQFLEPYISGVSLGESSEVDAPQINLQYAMLRVESHEPEIVEKTYFDRLIDFVYAEFMKGVQRGFIPKRCGNCGKWFLQTPGASYSYCENIAPGEENVTCREIGAKRSFRDRIKNDEIWQIHQRAYKKYFARIRRGTITKAEFEEWSRQAEQLRDEALKKYEKAWNDEQKATIIEQLQKVLNQK